MSYNDERILSALSRFPIRLSINFLGPVS